ncbi:hypothetical protein Tco_1326667 [Tanacetum coccineum]
MADKGKKSSMETFAPNDKADYYFRITSIIVNGKNAYELKEKFIDDLHNNAFDGTNGEEAVKHIEYFLKIVDPFDLPNVNHDKLQVVIFLISLIGKARRWFDKIKESIDSWVDLTAKFFRKYYPPSRTGKTNTQMIRWDPTNPKFENWLATKFVSDDESSDLEEYWSDKEEETAEIFKIETDVFDYETPLCLAFNEFNYLLKVDPDLLTKDIMGLKTYEDYKDDWIYEWNENVPWVYDKPWLDNEIWKEPKPVKHDCKPFNYKTGCSEWPTCSWREDGYCNRGNLPEAYHIGKSLYYQDLEWYEALEDSKLKNEALRNKAIMEGLINDDESCNDYWKRWKSHEIYYHDYEYENRTHEEGHELCEEYVAIKEDEYNDLTITSEEACRAYQEIFRMMDEGWMDLVKEISTNIGGEFTTLEILKCRSLETSRRLPRWQSQALLLATKTWRGSKGYDDGFGNQGTRLKTEDAPKDLEASPPPPHPLLIETRI